MFRKILIFVFAVLTLTIMILNLKSYVWAQISPLKVDVKLDRMIYVVDQEVVFTIYIRNVSQEAVDVIEPAIDRKSLRIEIIQPDQKKEKLLDIYDADLKQIRLYPKKRLKFKVKFSPELLGKYEIKVQYYGYEGQVLSAPDVSIFVVGA